jgi:hypothetical protein
MQLGMLAALAGLLLCFSVDFYLLIQKFARVQ